MKNLLRLMYVSKVYGQFDKAGLDELLEKSRSYNYTVGFTGVLSFGNSLSMQAFEKPETEVITLYSKIIADPRHHDCVVLSINKDDMLSNLKMLVEILRD